MSDSDFVADLDSDLGSAFDDDLAEDLSDFLPDFLLEALVSLFSASGAAFALCPRRALRPLPDFALALDDEEESLLSSDACALFLLRVCALAVVVGSEMRRCLPDETFVPEM